MRSPELAPLLGLLAEIGLLILLFFIGLHIDIDELRPQSSSGTASLSCTSLRKEANTTKTRLPAGSVHFSRRLIRTL